MYFLRDKLPLIYLIILIFLFSCFIFTGMKDLTVSAKEAQESIESTKAGQAIFDEVNCLLCHKLNGEGGGLDENAPDLAGVSSRKKPEEIRTWLKTHLYEEPRISMFEEDPTDQDIKNLADYLQTL